jgi:peptidoglycan/LPS O-acetylase OafA/YrhL
MAYLYIGKDFSALSVTSYAVHRFSRIAPAYLFIVLLSFIIHTAFYPDFTYAISETNILRHLLFSGNVSVFWSITPEVEFYFLFVLVWAAASRYLTRRSDITGLVLLTLGCLILMAYRDALPGTFVGSKLHYFVFGVIAGVIRSKMAAQQLNVKSLNYLHALLVAAMVSGAVVILAGHGSAILPFADYEAFYSSLLTAVFGAFAVFVFSFSSAVGNFFFANRAIIFCGECSFSIYLLHQPVIFFFHKYLPQPLPLIYLAPFIVVVLVLSWLNYRWIERPGARLIKSIGRVFEHKFVSAQPAATSVQIMERELR